MVTAESQSEVPEWARDGNSVPPPDLLSDPRVLGRYARAANALLADDAREEGDGETDVAKDQRKAA